MGCFTPGIVSGLVHSRCRHCHNLPYRTGGK
jgi:hypothetical protein